MANNQNSASTTNHGSRTPGDVQARQDANLKQNQQAAAQHAGRGQRRV